MVRNVRKLWRTRHQGSAALITTIAISAVLVVLFVGIATLATREIRQSINNDNANRALYGAEAGVEDAVRRLANNPKETEPTCNALTDNREVPVSKTGATTDVAWTCRTISQYLANLVGRISTDESIQLNTARAKSNADGTNPVDVKYIKIEWNKPSVDSPTPVSSTSTSSSFLPPYLQGYDISDTALWQNRAAAMEITATWLKNTITAADLSSLGGVAPVRTVVISPAGIIAPSGNTTDGSPWNGGAGCPSGNLRNSQACTPSASQELPSGIAVNSGALASDLTATCVNGASREYSCVAPSSEYAGNLYPIEKIMKTEYQTTDTSGNTVYRTTPPCDPAACVLVLRIKARYAPASYRITFYDAGKNPVYMSDGNATIDVTARSGTYYRRVLARKQLTPKAFDNVFDNALFSGTDICKTLKVYKDFRGAPDFSYTNSGGTIVRTPNADAGKNTGCTEG